MVRAFFTHLPLFLIHICASTLQGRHHLSFPSARSIVLGSHEHRIAM
ncbi:hypothetical protein BofuT4_uP032230.1 [Botrytis cinerea T4]|uniref:Uncharacterized protein n=1 Tax=Botryotinia fuckeliana (strain T4) TaxID=999810 RepID=G2Y9S1_BOTF4|nr:hypothetical protein BofuT4_uP032230.1 [Botrytis cinerea T4]